MKFSITTTSPVEVTVNWLIAGVSEDDQFSTSLQSIDEALGGSLTRMRERDDLTGKSGEITILGDVPALGADRLVLVGLGKSEKLTVQEFRKICAIAVRKAASNENQSLAICLPEAACESLGESVALEAVSDSVTVSCSGQGLYQDEKKRYSFSEVLLTNVDDSTENKTAIERGEILGQAVNLTRELVNRHPDDIYPDSFAQRAADEAADLGIRGEILDEEMLKDEKMGALLAVSQGSERPPRMVVLKYNGGGDDAPTLGFVGKGVTFDSGGLSLKTSAGMITMKSDMAGAATVLGAVIAIAKLKLPVNVIGYMGEHDRRSGLQAGKRANRSQRQDDRNSQHRCRRPISPC